MLFIGERLGGAGGFKVDIAVDPLEGTTLCAKNMPGAIATIARRLAQRQISLESIVQRHEIRPQGAGQPGRSGAPVPVILITYATTEDAVRKALAAVRRDRVISGRPQVIRIEKN